METLLGREGSRRRGDFIEGDIWSERKRENFLRSDEARGDRDVWRGEYEDERVGVANLVRGARAHAGMLVRHVGHVCHGRHARHTAVGVSSGVMMQVHGAHQRGAACRQSGGFSDTGKIGEREGQDSEGGDEAARHLNCARKKDIAGAGTAQHLAGARKGRGTLTACVQRPYPWISNELVSAKV